MKYIFCKYLIIIGLVFLSVSTFAQERKLKKLNKLLEKEKIEKCYKKGLKVKKKHPRSAEIHIIFSKIYLFHFNEEESLRKKNRHLLKVIKHYESAFKYTEDSVELDIHDVVKSHADSMYYSKWKSKSKTYYKFLAEYYLDTSTFYFEFYTPNSVAKKEIIVTTEDALDLRKQLISNSELLVGIPYKYGGETKSGFDCSGFTKFAYSTIGIDLPHNAHLQSNLGKTIHLKDAKPGDMIFFGYMNENKYRVVHAGIIYTKSSNNIEIIHCVSRGVQIDDQQSDNWQFYWKDRVLFVKRIINDID